MTRDDTATPDPKAPSSSPPYHVIAERDGRGWRVRIPGVGGPTGLEARDLTDIERRVRKLIWSYTGKHPADIELDVEVRLPPAIQLRLDLAEQLCDEAGNEIEGAIGDFVGAQFSMNDVGRVLESHYCLPRPFTITNGEILRHGMSQVLGAVGIRWDDRGRFMTVTCRDCVEATREAYIDLPPDDLNLLIYDPSIICDSCCQSCRLPASE